VLSVFDVSQKKKEDRIGTVSKSPRTVLVVGRKGKREKSPRSGVAAEKKKSRLVRPKSTLEGGWVRGCLSGRTMKKKHVDGERLKGPEMVRPGRRPALKGKSPECHYAGGKKDNMRGKPRFSPEESG